MQLFRWALGGLFGGLIGAAIWAAITYFTEYEVGYVAWGIGLLVGLGVRKNAGPSVGFGPGAVAAVIALCAVLGGKYAAVHFQVKDAFDQHLAAPLTDELLISILADEVIVERQQAGQSVQWPAGVLPEEADSETDYPQDVWAEAAARWNTLGAEVQTQMRNDQEAARAAFVAEFRDTVEAQAFTESFGAYDLLWFGLALFTAFRVGAGSEEEAPSEPAAGDNPEGENPETETQKDRTE